MFQGGTVPRMLASCPWQSVQLFLQKANEDCLSRNSDNLSRNCNHDFLFRSSSHLLRQLQPQLDARSNHMDKSDSEGACATAKRTGKLRRSVHGTAGSSAPCITARCESKQLMSWILVKCWLILAHHVATCFPTVRVRAGPCTVPWPLHWRSLVRRQGSIKARWLCIAGLESTNGTMEQKSIELRHPRPKRSNPVRQRHSVSLAGRRAADRASPDRQKRALSSVSELEDVNTVLCTG